MKKIIKLLRSDPAYIVLATGAPVLFWAVIYPTSFEPYEGLILLGYFIICGVALAIFTKFD